MPTLYSTAYTWGSRGAHPWLTGTPLNVPGGEGAKMSAIDGSSGTMALSGSNHAGTMEWVQPGASSLTIPGAPANVITTITVKLVARFASSVTFIGDSRWVVQLYNQATGQVLGLAQRLTVPVQTGLNECVAGGVDAWGVDTTALLAILAANTLRVRLISPEWNPASTGSLVIDGLQVSIDYGPAASTEVNVAPIPRSAVPGRVPGTGAYPTGTVAANIRDQQLFVVDDLGVPVPQLSCRLFSTAAKYALNDVVLYNRQFYYANKATGPGNFTLADWTVVDAGNALKLAGQGLDTLFWFIAPLKMPFLWFGTLAELPVNWQAADGTNGTVDMRGRIVEGASNEGEVAGVTGSSWTATSTSNGAHTHSVDVPIPIDVATYNGSGGATATATVNGQATDGTTTISVTSGSSGAHTHSTTIDPKRARGWFIVRIS